MAEFEELMTLAVRGMAEFESLVLNESSSLGKYILDGLEEVARLDGRQRFCRCGPHGKRYRAEITSLESASVAFQLLRYLMNERAEYAGRFGFWSLEDPQLQARSQLALYSLTGSCVELLQALAENLARGHKITAFSLFRTLTEFSNLTVAVLASRDFHSKYLDWIQGPKESLSHWRLVGPSVAQRTVNQALRDAGFANDILDV